jgi:RNA recognition motif-containing protein
MKSDYQHKIFVGNVPFDCTKKEFEECFNNMDGFENAEIINKFNSDSSRGFGFVTFNNKKNALSLLTKNIEFKDRILRFTEYSSNDKKEQHIDMLKKNYIFIKKIPSELSRDDIKIFFENYGEVGSCFINTDTRTGESKGNAVVEIKNNQVYENLLDIKTIVYNNDISLDLSKWCQKIRVRTKPVKSENNEMYRNAFNPTKTFSFSK